MDLLPIARRELRAAARRRVTRWFRFWITVAAICVCGLFLLVSSRTGASRIGLTVFWVLVVYAFGLCLLSGVVVTSDCLSEEKRSGTLGLLFLTNLKAYDVVLGKFVARALNPFLAWLAILPVISLSILLGGVTGGEFWRMALALFNALFISLSVGICVSAFSRDAQRAWGVTLGLLVLIAGALPLVTYNSIGSTHEWLFRFFGLISPYTAFASAMDASYAANAASYWGGLVAGQFFGWTLLLLATLKIRNSWQDKPVARKKSQPPAFPKVAASRRREHPDVMPWLFGRRMGIRFVVWGICLAWVLFVFVGFWFPTTKLTPAVTLFGSRVVGFLLKIIFVGQVCQFFLEARRGGLMESLLCTPLSDKEIIQSQWRHLRRLFLLPLMIFFLPAAASFLAGMSDPASLLPWDWVGQTSMGAGWFIFSSVIDFIALGWVGFWLALSMKKSGLAPGATILCVLVTPILLLCIPGIFTDLLFMAWACERLHRTPFRKHIAEQYSLARPVS